MFRHNTTESRLRRPAGLSDKQWDTLNLMLSLSLKKEETLIHEALHNIVNLDKLPSDIKGKIASIMGYDSQSTSIRPNVRFFRHFCPEDIRYPVNRSLMPAATLVYDGEGNVQWVSEKVMQTTIENKLIDLPIGTTIIIRMEGMYKVNRITVTSARSLKVVYDCRNSETMSFGDAVFNIKRLILQNQRRKNEV